MKLPLAGASLSTKEPPAQDAALGDARLRARTTRHLTLDEAMALACADGHAPVVPGDVPGGKSVCLCRHRGDGSMSEHAGLIGHGYRKAASCGCAKFSWRRFIWEKE